MKGLFLGVGGGVGSAHRDVRGRGFSRIGGGEVGIVVVSGGMCFLWGTGGGGKGNGKREAGRGGGRREGEGRKKGVCVDGGDIDALR